MKPVLGTSSSCIRCCRPLSMLLSAASIRRLAAAVAKRGSRRALSLASPSASFHAPAVPSSSLVLGTVRLGALRHAFGRAGLLTSYSAPGLLRHGGRAAGRGAGQRWAPVLGHASSALMSGGPSRRSDDDETDAERLEREKRALQAANDADAPRSRLGQLLVGLPVVGALFGKTKYLLVGAKLLKFKSLASMLVSVGVYSMFFGLPYAVGVVGMLVVHESGHALVMLQRGIPVASTMFIPFVGAAVTMKERPADAYESALVAFGGPVIGGLGALAVAGAGVATGSQLLLAVADFGFFINMLNMLPVGSLDGGHIAGAVSKHFLLAGLAAGCAAVAVFPVYNPVIYIVLLAGGYTTWQRYQGGDEEEAEGFYDIPPNAKAGIGAGYLATIAALFAAWQWNKRRLMSPAQLRRAKEEGTLEEIQQAGYINDVADPFDPGDEDIGEAFGGISFYKDTPEAEAKRERTAHLQHADRSRQRSQGHHDDGGSPFIVNDLHDSRDARDAHGYEQRAR